MKLFLLFYSAFVFCSAASEEIVLHRIHSAKGGRPVNYQVERAEIEKVPKWEPKAGSKPPLGSDEAVGIAKRSSIASGVGEKAETAVTLETTNRYEKDILKKLPEEGCRWFYVVEFREKEREPVFVVVTMSGAVATPVPAKK